ncbi:hypothetical protein hbim_02189 [Mycolicibacterium mageritense]|uniref:Uncharacterized protein n=1 Tax=Mycolicibacterium mageritense TaxID=53462 RepID=A0AAI8XMZ2_MYCME|nr:hypothetical protein hbim_02189 [Mycolicibacterium mageritense]
MPAAAGNSVGAGTPTVVAPILPAARAGVARSAVAAVLRDAPVRHAAAASAAAVRTRAARAGAATSLAVAGAWSSTAAGFSSQVAGVAAEAGPTPAAGPGNPALAAAADPAQEAAVPGRPVQAAPARSAPPSWARRGGARPDAQSHRAWDRTRGSSPHWEPATAATPSACQTAGEWGALGHRRRDVGQVQARPPRTDRRAHRAHQVAAAPRARQPDLPTTRSAQRWVQRRLVVVSRGQPVLRHPRHPPPLPKQVLRQLPARPAAPALPAHAAHAVLPSARVGAPHELRSRRPQVPRALREPVRSRKPLVGCCRRVRARHQVGPIPVQTMRHRRIRRRFRRKHRRCHLRRYPQPHRQCLLRRASVVARATGQREPRCRRTQKKPPAFRVAVRPARILQSPPVAARVTDQHARQCRQTRKHPMAVPAMPHHRHHQLRCPRRDSRRSLRAQREQDREIPGKCHHLLHARDLARVRRHRLGRENARRRLPARSRHPRSTRSRCHRPRRRAHRRISGRPHRTRTNRHRNRRPHRVRDAAPGQHRQRDPPALPPAIAAHLPLGSQGGRPTDSALARPGAEQFDVRRSAEGWPGVHA